MGTKTYSLNALTDGSHFHCRGLVAQLENQLKQGKTPFDACSRGLNISPMRVLLKDAGTGLYYNGRGSCVAEPAVAMDFDCIETAGREAIRHESDLNVVLRYDNPVQEVELNPAYCVGWNTIRSTVQQRQLAH